jgi:dihydropyrimidine dehydrogenase (NAD+) subunit PreA
MTSNNLSVDFCGVPFENPFMLAASPSTDDKDMIARGFEAGWAGAVLKTTSVETDEVTIAYPIMASLRRQNQMVGLHNIDLISERRIDAISEDVVWLKERFPEHRVVLSIVAETKDEWEFLVKRAEEVGADLVEASISCPQGAMLEGEETIGWMISQDPVLTEKVTRWLKDASDNIPVYVKLGSGVTDLVAIGKAVAAGGGDGICAIDSVEGIIGVDHKTLSPLPSVQGYSSAGGYTGRAIKPIGLRCVADLARGLKIPISGVGGIYTWQDALDYMLLGATTIQVCTAVMHQGFRIVKDLEDGLTHWLEDMKFTNLNEIIGLSLPRLAEHDDLPHDADVVSRIKSDQCIGCGLCYIACEDGGHKAIDFCNTDRIPVVDIEKCVGCALCAQVCPVPYCINMEVVVLE